MMDRKQTKAFKQLGAAVMDQGQALIEQSELQGRLETNQVNIEGLLSEIVGVKIDDDFLTRKEASNDDAAGGDDA